MSKADMEVNKKGDSYDYLIKKCNNSVLKDSLTYFELQSVTK